MIDDLAHCKRPSVNSAWNHYQIARNEALDHMLLEFIVKNSSFVVDYNLNEVFDTNPIHDLSFVYNTLSMFALNTCETWDLMKSKFKPFVVCAICQCQIKWTMDENVEVELQGSFLKQSKFISDNDRYTYLFLGFKQIIIKPPGRY